MLSEREITERLFEIEKGGAQARREGKSCPYPGNTLFAYVHGGGWLKEDLRIALCNASPSYRRGQIQYDPSIERYLKPVSPMRDL